MSNILNSEDFGLKIYNRFPPKYREDDVGQNYALMRYLQSLSDGGFKYSIEEINGITNLIDPDRTDSKVLPILFKQYGLEIFKGIPEQYLRYLLPKLGEAWSKKGSLSVVEFITSSLSGIKTSSYVTYNEKEDPTVNVRLEMDYSLGDYFPEAESFKRLLENFVPYYSDIVLVYSYMFYESQILGVKDHYQLINIKDNVKDVASVSFHDEHLGYDFVYTVNESLELKSDEKNIYKVGTSKFIESSKLLLKDNTCVRDITKLIYNESGILRLRQKLPVEYEYSNATFGEAIFGQAVFDHGKEESDIYIDIIKDTKEDKVTLNVSGDNSLVNSMQSTLNGLFYTNNINCYDVVTIGGSSQVLF